MAILWALLVVNEAGNIKQNDNGADSKQMYFLQLKNCSLIFLYFMQSWTLKVIVRECCSCRKMEDFKKRSGNARSQQGLFHTELQLEAHHCPMPSGPICLCHATWLFPWLSHGAGGHGLLQGSCKQVAVCPRLAANLGTMVSLLLTFKHPIFFLSQTTPVYEYRLRLHWP